MHLVFLPWERKRKEQKSPILVGLSKSKSNIKYWSNEIQAIGPWVQTIISWIALKHAAGTISSQWSVQKVTSSQKVKTAENVHYCFLLVNKIGFIAKSYGEALWLKQENQIKMKRSFKAKVKGKVRRQTFAPPQDPNRRRSSVENVVTNIMRIEDFRNQKDNAIKVTDDNKSTKELSKRKVMESETSETEIEPEM